MATQDHEVLAVTMHIPEEDVLVMGPRGNDSTDWVELHTINGTLVARKKHDRGLQTGGTMLSPKPHRLGELNARPWGK
jgi:hypothetical protein